MIQEGPQFSIGEKRDGKIHQTPGPGDYEIKSEKRDGITIGTRHQSKQTEELPGPGQYIDPSATPSGPQFSIGEKRENKIASTPGPGQYEVKADEAKGITIATKYAEKHHENIPGPGQYEKKSMIQEGPQFSIGEKRESKIPYTPGPG